MNRVASTASGPPGLVWPLRIWARPAPCSRRGDQLYLSEVRASRACRSQNSSGQPSENTGKSRRRSDPMLIETGSIAVGSWEPCRSSNRAPENLRALKRRRTAARRGPTQILAQGRLPHRRFRINLSVIDKLLEASFLDFGDRRSLFGEQSRRRSPPHSQLTIPGTPVLSSTSPRPWPASLGLLLPPAPVRKPTRENAAVLAESNGESRVDGVEATV